MYDQVVERIATVLDDVPEIRSVLVGLEETGETPSIRIWIDKAVQPQQPGKTAFRREVVHLCVQVDSWSPKFTPQAVLLQALLHHGSEPEPA